MTVGVWLQKPPERDVLALRVVGVGDIHCAKDVSVVGYSDRESLVQSKIYN